ncbi:hypothetical protein AB205_0219190 [Aquarana catesbeiana]|uniref:TIL domain-containing protein n=1 Tax=Aquarana catesbeiana TaxID=8400 RepID=A0A2G9RVI8_AQUCT|nr:hypothetical protein AB205_0219190 [Aquarana catesbeiana]
MAYLAPGGTVHLGCRECVCHQGELQCNRQNCEGEAFLSEWSEWTPCSRCIPSPHNDSVPPSFYSVQHRHRICLNARTGFPWSRDSPSCRGELTRERVCPDQGVCDDLCVWNEWGEWSPCREPCSGGFRSRWRHVYHPMDVTQCQGARFQSESCNTAACPGENCEDRGKASKVACANKCPRSCADLWEHVECLQGQCRTGCRCPEGWLLQDKTCVPMEDCRCGLPTSNGSTEYEPGAIVHIECNNWWVHSNPRYTNPGFTNPRYTNPGYTSTMYPNPRYSNPRYTNPEYTNPRYTNPRYTNPRYTNPRYTNPGYTNPGYTNPGFTNPRYTNPGYSDLRYTNPRYTNPRYTNPRYTNPGYTNPGYTNPRYTNPRYTNPGYTNPGYTNPGYTNPGYTNPRYTNPGYTNPGYTNPGYTNPRYTNPGYTNPRYTNPRYTNPRYTNPGYTNHGYTNPRYTNPRYTNPRYTKLDTCVNGTFACTDLLCPVYGPWTEWGPCSVSCGGGHKWRSRSCTERGPDEATCGSDSREVEECNNELCPDIASYP